MRTQEDNSQYKQYLKLKYPDRDIDKLYGLIMSRIETQDIKKQDAEVIYALSDIPDTKSSLEVILFPDNNKLSSVPIYRRYAAYLISEFGYAKACSLLYISRTSLWRLLSQQEP